MLWVMMPSPPLAESGHPEPRADFEATTNTKAASSLASLERPGDGSSLADRFGPSALQFGTADTLRLCTFEAADGEAGVFPLRFAQRQEVALRKPEIAIALGWISL